MTIPNRLRSNEEVAFNIIERHNGRMKVPKGGAVYIGKDGRKVKITPEWVDKWRRDNPNFIRDHILPSQNTRRKVGLKKTKKRKVHVGKRGGLYVIKYKKNPLTGQNTAYKSYLKQ